MAVGEAFAVQETTAETSVSNTTEATETYGAAAQLEQGDWSGQWDGTAEQLTIPAANNGLPILVGHSKLTRTDGTTRACATDTVRVNLTNQDVRGASTGRYIRNIGATNVGTSNGVGIFEPSTDDTLEIRRAVSFNSSSRFGGYDRSAGDPKGFWAAVLPASDRLYMSLSATASASGRYGTTTRPIDLGPTPSALDEGTWGQMTWNNDAGFPIGSTFAHTDGAGTFTIAANSKVLAVLTFQVDGGVERTAAVVRIRQSSGTSYEGAAVSTYTRNAGSQFMCGSLIVPIFTGGAAETVDVVFADQVETGPPVVDVIAASLQLIDLTKADWVSVASDVRDASLIDGIFKTSAWNQTLREDTDSWSHDPVTNNSRLTNSSGETITAIAGFSQFWDCESTTSVIRKIPHSQIAKNGTRLDYGVGGEYSRSTDSPSTYSTYVAGYSHAVPVELDASQYVELQHRDLENTTFHNRVIANDLYTGASLFWAVRIDNLDRPDEYPHAGWPKKVRKPKSKHRRYILPDNRVFTDPNRALFELHKLLADNKASEPTQADGEAESSAILENEEVVAPLPDTSPSESFPPSALLSDSSVLMKEITRELPQMISDGPISVETIDPQLISVLLQRIDDEEAALLLL